MPLDANAVLALLAALAASIAPLTGAVLLQGAGQEPPEPLLAYTVGEDALGERVALYPDGALSWSAPAQGIAREGALSAQEVDAFAARLRASGVLDAEVESPCPPAEGPGEVTLREGERLKGLKGEHGWAGRDLEVGLVFNRVISGAPRARLELVDVGRGRRIASAWAAPGQRVEEIFRRGSGPGFSPGVTVKQVSPPGEDAYVVLEVGAAARAPCPPKPPLRRLALSLDGVRKELVWGEGTSLPAPVQEAVDAVEAWKARLRGQNEAAAPGAPEPAQKVPAPTQPARPSRELQPSPEPSRPGAGFPPAPEQKLPSVPPPAPAGSEALAVGGVLAAAALGALAWRFFRGAGRKGKSAKGAR